MNLKTLLEQLKQEGWNISEEFIEEHLQVSDRHSYHDIAKHLLNVNLKDIGSSCLPSDLQKGKSYQLSTPVVLQVANIRNVAAPKANEDSGAAPRMLRITLTDGCNFIHGLEIDSIPSLSLKISPGTKIKLISRVGLLGGYFLLSPQNTVVLGGIVTELYEKWKMSQNVSKYSRAVVSLDGSGPPPWVPFGQKIISNWELQQNFKALADSPTKTKEDDEFENLRQQTVKELSKDGCKKVFGGGKQMLDTNIQKIVNAGFTIEDARRALYRTKNDVHKSIRELKMGTDDLTSQLFGDEQNFTRDRGRRGRGRGRTPVAGPDGSDDDMPQIGSDRPSGPSYLSDFLENKMLLPKKVKSESGQTDRYSRFNGQDYQERSSRGRGRGHRDFNNTRTTSAKATPLLEIKNWPVVGQQSDGASSHEASGALPVHQENNISKQREYDDYKQDIPHNYEKKGGFDNSDYKQSSYNIERKPQFMHSSKNGTVNSKKRIEVENNISPQRNEPLVVTERKRKTEESFYDARQLHNTGNRSYSKDYSYQQPNYQYAQPKQHNYYEPQSKKQNYPESQPKQQNYPKSQPKQQNYLESQHKQQNYHDSQPKQQNYPESQHKQQNYPESEHKQQNYPESQHKQQNYQASQHNYQDTHPNHQNYRSSQHKYPDYQAPLFAQQNYQNFQQNDEGIHPKQRNYQTSEPKQQYEHSSYSGVNSGNIATSQRSYTQNQKDLISKFQQSMVLSGCYESETENALCTGKTPNYQSGGASHSSGSQYSGSSYNSGNQYSGSSYNSGNQHYNDEYENYGNARGGQRDYGRGGRSNRGGGRSYRY